MKNEERISEIYEAHQTIFHHDVLSNTPHFGGCFLFQFFNDLHARMKL